jgi:hypothetical protein
VIPFLPEPHPHRRDTRPTWPRLAPDPPQWVTTPAHRGARRQPRGPQPGADTRPHALAAASATPAEGVGNSPRGEPARHRGHKPTGQASAAARRREAPPGPGWATPTRRWATRRGARRGGPARLSRPAAPSPPRGRGRCTARQGRSPRPRAWPCWRRGGGRGPVAWASGGRGRQAPAVTWSRRCWRTARLPASIGRGCLPRRPSGSAGRGCGRSAQASSGARCVASAAGLGATHGATRSRGSVDNRA